MPVDSHDPTRRGEGIVSITGNGLQSHLPCRTQQAGTDVTLRESAYQQKLQRSIPRTVVPLVIDDSKAAIIPLAAALTE